MRKILIITLCAVILLAGCSKADPYENVVIDMSDEFISQAETMYCVVLEDGDVYLTDSQPDVKEITSVTSSLVKALSDRSYKTMDGREGYEYLSTALLQKNEDNNDAEATVKAFTVTEQITENIGLEIIYIEFDETGEKATVKYKAKTRIHNSVDWFKGEVNAVDDVFEAKHIFIFILTDEEWRVDKILFNVV